MRGCHYWLFFCFRFLNTCSLTHLLSAFSVLGISGKGPKVFQGIFAMRVLRRGEGERLELVSTTLFSVGIS